MVIAPLPGSRTLFLAGLLGCAGVLLGAFTAHGLAERLEQRGLDPERVSRRVEQMDTAVRYHLLHTVALLAVATVVRQPLGLRWHRLIVALLVAGIVLFSGSLYLLVALDRPWFGAITPFGGLAWVLAWGLLAVAALRRPPTDSHIDG